MCSVRNKDYPAGSVIFFAFFAVIFMTIIVCLH